MDEKYEEIFKILYPNYNELTEKEKQEADEMRKFISDNYEEIVDAANYAIDEAIDYGIQLDDETALYRAIKWVKNDSKSNKTIKPEDVFTVALKGTTRDTADKANGIEEHSKSPSEHINEGETKDD